MRIETDARLAELLQILQASCNFVEEKEELPIAKLAEDMVPADLDEIESDCVRFDEFLAKQAGMEDSDSRINEYENEVASMDRDLAHCKQRHQQLISGEEDPESPEELTYLESQLQDISHELALLGIPTENGSMTTPYFDADKESACSAYTMPLQPLKLERPEIDETIQPRLFDDADVENPMADGGEGEPLSQAEIDDYFDEMDARVIAWMDDFDGSMDPDIPSSPLPLDSGLNYLPEAQLSNSVSCTLPPAHFSEYEQVVAKARLQAWAVQLARDCEDTFQRVGIESPYIALPQKSEE